jgi:predicted component of type VI protein secretion system
MVKDSLAVGRGGQSAWVDVQVMTTSKVSREHFRIRRDADGRFFIRDVSLWGTSVDDEPLPAALKTAAGVIQAGAERELPASARIGLAGAMVIQFEVVR